jgi:hypothetical protein
MNELTLCNYCTYERMKRAAKKRGTKTFIVHERTGDFAGWVSAYYKDRPNQAAARFKQLTAHCVC